MTRLLKIPLVGIIIFVVVFSSAQSCWALSGVGGELWQTQGTSEITLIGKHAPNAEIVVSDSNGKVVANGLALANGDFNFKFKVTALQVPGLVVVGNDLASVTAPVQVPVSGLNGVLMPPSIAVDDSFQSGDEQILVGGYSYPGAQVTATLVENNLVVTTIQVVAAQDGSWQWLIKNQQPGDYQVKATSRLDTTLSADSYLIDLNIVPTVQDRVNKVVDTVVPNVVKEVAKQVAPGANQVAQSVAPVASAGLLTQLALILKDLIYWLIQAGIALMQYFGFWRRRKPWGVVYDAITKQPIMLATVRLFAIAPTKKLIETDVTSKAGVFSFFPEPGRYIIQAAKTGYTFPSKLIKSSSDGEYGHVYLGQEITFSNQDSLVDVSIPLDPAEVNVGWRFKVTNFIRTRIYLLTLVMLAIGALMSLIAVIGGQVGFNLILLIFYTAVLIFHAYQVYLKGKSWGIVVNEVGKPLVGIQLSLIEAKFGRLVQRRVTDQKGKYQFVVPEGEYLIRVDTQGVTLVTGVRKTYGGERIIVAGKKPQLINFKLVIRVTETAK